MSELEKIYYESLCTRLNLFGMYDDNGEPLYCVYELLDFILDKVEKS